MSETWDIPEAELPPRGVPTRTAAQELQAAGYKASTAKCWKCGIEVIGLDNGGRATPIVCNKDGSLHADCRESRDPVPEPLPPPLTFEQQQEKLDALMRERGLKE
jgi:hypothetical protein